MDPLLQPIHPLAGARPAPTPQAPRPSLDGTRQHCLLLLARPQTPCRSATSQSFSRRNSPLRANYRPNAALASALARQCPRSNLESGLQQRNCDDSRIENFWKQSEIQDRLLE